MREKEVIHQLKTLRKIRPNNDWVVFARKEIVGEEDSGFHFFLKPALTLSLLGIFILSSFAFAQNSLPGDTLYPLKKITERVKVALAPQDKKPTIQLELTAERLRELKQIAKENKIEKLKPAIAEVSQTIPQTTKTIQEIVKEKKNIKNVKEIVKKVDEIEKTKKEVQALGIVVGDDELEKTSQELRKELVEDELNDLENRSLTQDQEKLFQKAKKYYEEGDYSKALETIFYLTNLNSQ